MVAPDAALGDSPAGNVVLVPGISASTSEPFTNGDRRLFDWLGLRKRQGAQIVSACTGALVLAEAGLLDGVEATSHWAFRDVFRTHYPRVRLRADRNLCCASNGIVTSGGTTAWQQLALFLITHYCGREHAVRTAKFWLLSDSGEFQGPYAAMPFDRLHEDAAIRDCQTWIVEHFAVQHPVDTMMARSCLPPSTFARRFRRATGYTPMEYVHAVRVEEAKQILESTDRPVEHVGRKVGYEDTASFRRLFKRQTGLTPRDYRRLFGRARFDRYVDDDRLLRPSKPPPADAPMRPGFL
jgi:transcriptional regulator GlxA family with amidase domain